MLNSLIGQNTCIYTRRCSAKVDTNEVTVDPGVDYCNWLRLSKQHLKERDSKLLQIKTTNTEQIVHRLLNTTTFTVKQQIIDNTKQILNEAIDDWKGINVRRTKKSIQAYKEYFFIARNSCYQRKRKLFGDIFWVLVFRDIEQITLDDHPLFLRILKALFNATIEYKDTKNHSLINMGTVINSTEIQKYLYNIHHSIAVKQWIKENKSSKGKATIIGGKIRHMLQMVSIQMSESKSKEKKCIHSQNEKNNVCAPINIPLPCPLPMPPLSNPMTPLPMPMNGLNVLPFIPEYTGFHNSAYSVSDRRHSPLNSNGNNLYPFQNNINAQNQLFSLNQMLTNSMNMNNTNNSNSSAPVLVYLLPNIGGFYQ